jgi:hypothetical protein
MVNDVIDVLRMSLEMNNNKLVELISGLTAKLRPRLVDGKVIFESTPEFEAELERETKIRVGIQHLENKMREVDELLDRANSIMELPERTLSGIQQAALIFSNRNANAAVIAKQHLEDCLSRGIPIRDASAMYLEIVEERAPSVKENNRKAEQLHELANQIRTLCS